MYGKVKLESNHVPLVEGFNWAKRQALDYVFDDDPVGPWFVAALLRRNAFCMRDVSHHSTGANVLGLQRHLKNMLGRFAGGISESKDWCTFWEIDREGKPCKSDYKSDKKFWYNLPSNFDILDCCYRQYKWTGDKDYLRRKDFSRFYDLSVNEFVKRWDRDGDGIPDHKVSDHTRGLASYNESVKTHLTAADMISMQYSGYLAYAAISRLNGKDKTAEKYLEKAKQLKEIFNAKWWSEEDGQYHYLMMQDRSFRHLCSLWSLHCRICDDGDKTESCLSSLRAAKIPGAVEGRAYLPHVWYDYGWNKDAFDELIEQMSPEYIRRRYPEVSFCIIGSIASGMMGISPDASCNEIKTLPRLTSKTKWVGLSDVPLLSNEISVRHHGCTASCIRNQSGKPFKWRAAFSGRHSSMIVDGKKMKAVTCKSLNNQLESSVVVNVDSHQIRTAKI